jgi:hypothetical protein
MWHEWVDVERHNDKGGCYVTMDGMVGMQLRPVPRKSLRAERDRALRPAGTHV